MLKRFQSFTVLTTLALSTLITSAHAAQKGNSGKNGKGAQAPAPVLLPSEPCPDSWRLSGSYLYMMPTVDDTFFVIDSEEASTQPIGTRKNNDFDFQSGFRVGAEYSMCNMHRTFQAFYTRLSADQQRQIEGNHLWATLGRSDLTATFENYEGLAFSKQNLLYQRMDLNVSQQFVNAKEIYFYLQPGIELAYLRLKEHFRYHTALDESANIRQKSKVEGVGPQLGLAMDYSLFQGSYSPKISHALTFNGLCSGSILMSYSKAKGDQELNDVTILHVHDAKTWRTIPALHARTGIQYIVQGPRVGFTIGVAYEFNTYIRGLNRVLYSDDTADAQSFNNYNNFDVQGLSVTASLSF